jgi:4-hydroxy-tetrahydrodipicolinate synthase
VKRLYFGRLITAMVTPFKDDGNAIDFARTGTLIEHLLQTGSDALVISGTTGESPTLSHDEKLALFRFTKEFVGNRAKVIVGASSNDTSASIQLSKDAEECEVDGLLLVTPYYNRPSQEGLYQHFKAIASSVELPCMLYNVPSRTGSNLEPETQVRLAQIENIVATKEAGSFDQLLKLATIAPSDLDIYTGEDKMLLPLLSLGGVGVVSVTSHVIGAQMKSLIHAYLDGDHQEAIRLNKNLMPVFEGMFADGNPNPTLVKACLNAMGIQCGPLRLPLIEPTPEALDTLVKLVASATK